jgi:hypothetical protein
MGHGEGSSPKTNHLWNNKEELPQCGTDESYGGWPLPPRFF